MRTDPFVVQVDIGDIVHTFKDNVNPSAFCSSESEFGAVIAGPSPVHPSRAAVIGNHYLFPTAAPFQDKGEVGVVFSMIPELKSLKGQPVPLQGGIGHMILQKRSVFRS